VLFVFVGNIGIKPRRRSCSAVRLPPGPHRLGPWPWPDPWWAARSSPRGTPVWLIGALAIVSGAARSVGLTGYSTLAFADIPQERMRHANALNATANQMAAGLGVAAATVALRIGAR